MPDSVLSESDPKNWLSHDLGEDYSSLSGIFEYLQARVHYDLHRIREELQLGEQVFITARMKSETSILSKLYKNRFPYNKSLSLESLVELAMDEEQPTRLTDIVGARLVCTNEYTAKQMISFLMQGESNFRFLKGKFSTSSMSISPENQFHSFLFGNRFQPNWIDRPTVNIEYFAGMENEPPRRYEDVKCYITLRRPSHAAKSKSIDPPLASESYISQSLRHIVNRLEQGIHTLEAFGAFAWNVPIEIQIHTFGTFWFADAQRWQYDNLKRMRSASASSMGFYERERDSLMSQSLEGLKSSLVSARHNTMLINQALHGPLNQQIVPTSPLEFNLESRLSKCIQANSISTALSFNDYCNKLLKKQSEENVSNFRKGLGKAVKCISNENKYPRFYSIINSATGKIRLAELYEGMLIEGTFDETEFRKSFSEASCHWMVFRSILLNIGLLALYVRGRSIDDFFQIIDERIRVIALFVVQVKSASADDEDSMHAWKSDARSVERDCHSVAWGIFHEVMRTDHAFSSICLGQPRSIRNQKVVAKLAEQPFARAVAGILNDPVPSWRMATISYLNGSFHFALKYIDRAIRDQEERSKYLSEVDPENRFYPIDASYDGPDAVDMQFRALEYRFLLVRAGSGTLSRGKVESELAEIRGILEDVSSLYQAIPLKKLQADIELNARVSSFLALLGYTGLVLDANNSGGVHAKLLYFQSMVPFKQLLEIPAIKRPGNSAVAIRAREVKRKVWFVAAELCIQALTKEWNATSLAPKELESAERDHINRMYSLFRRLNDIAHHPSEKTRWWASCISQLDGIVRSQFTAARSQLNSDDGRNFNLVVNISNASNQAFSDIEKAEEDLDILALSNSVASIANNLLQIIEGSA